MNMKRIVIAQGGGPTVVINQTLVGVIEQAQKMGVSDIWGAHGGVRGMAEGQFFNMSSLSQEHLQAVAMTPSAALASTRDKPDDTYCATVCAVLAKHHIDGVFYIGGNDTSATLMQLSAFSQQHKGHPLRAVHVPKTIDNDLVCNDHVPGYGSAARYVALALRGLDFDQRALAGIHLVVVMGRHAGFLTAAAAALQRGEDEGPHIICLPEDEFDEDSFLAAIDNCHARYGRCLIAMSEGIKGRDGKPIITQLTRDETDAHGNVQLSGSGALGDALAARIKKAMPSARVRSDTLGYMQRCFPAVVSDTDATEAREAGRKAVEFALQQQKDGSVTLNRNEAGETVYGYENLQAIGGKTRYLPNEFWHKGKWNLTPAFVQWVKPLLGSDLPVLTSLQAKKI